MQPLGSTDILLFDGDCGICTWSAERARRIARDSGYAVQPYQAYSEEELRRFGTDHAHCSKRIHAITRTGRVYTGAFAVNHFCWRHFPWTLIPLVIYLLFPLIAVEVAVYELVARNRTRISRSLGLTACAVPRRTV